MLLFKKKVYLCETITITQMKRIAILLFSLLLGITLNAQDHLSFKNIPLGGKISEFVATLKAQGFEVVAEVDAGAALKGPFVGFDDCTVLVLATKKTHSVWKVVAQLPEQRSWSSTYSRYDDFKQKYIEKYGKPTKTYEFFTSPYEKGDGYELQAISLEKGYYNNYWVMPAGTIVVKIEANSNSRGYVSLGYEDALATEIKDKEDNAIIEDDI